MAAGVWLYGAAGANVISVVCDQPHGGPSVRAGSCCLGCSVPFRVVTRATCACWSQACSSNLPQLGVGLAPLPKPSSPHSSTRGPIDPYLRVHSLPSGPRPGAPSIDHRVQLLRRKLPPDDHVPLRTLLLYHPHAPALTVVIVRQTLIYHRLQRLLRKFLPHLFAVLPHDTRDHVLAIRAQSRHARLERFRHPFHRYGVGFRIMYDVPSPLPTLPCPPHVRSRASPSHPAVPIILPIFRESCQVPRAPSLSPWVRVRAAPSCPAFPSITLPALHVSCHLSGARVTARGGVSSSNPTAPSPTPPSWRPC